MTNKKNAKNGSFISGFSLGMLLGAAGYFMFNTKDSADLKKKLRGEWDQVKGFLAKSGVIPNEDMSVKDLADYLMKHGEESFAEQIVAASSTSSKNKKTSKSKVKKPKSKKRSVKRSAVKKNKFKGV